MTDRILLTTTSFQDTPGAHQRLLAEAPIEVVRARGPLPEETMVELVGEVDGLLCGDDAISAAVIDAALPRLRVISKYGIGLDKIDVAHATQRSIPVLFTPGVNHTTVAEHTFGLLIALSKHIVEIASAARAGAWKRMTGHEIAGRALGIVGLGRIGKEVAIRARAFGMPVLAHDIAWDSDFAARHGIERCAALDELLARAEILSLHCFLSEQTRGLIRAETIARMRPGVVIVNCARGELVRTPDLVAALESGALAGYATDVLDREPPPPDHPLLRAPNCLVTAHIGSRTYESVERQATMAARNLLLYLAGEKPLAQANELPGEAR